MKKVKIMLMSLAVLAIVGGALAFKAAKFNSSFCTVAAQFTIASPANIYYCPDDPNWDGSKACAQLDNVQIQPNGRASTTNVCTTPLLGSNCNGIQCTTLTTVFKDN